MGEMARYTAGLQANLPPMVLPDTLCIFSRLGDGNLQTIVLVAPQDCAAALPPVEALVYGLLESFYARSRSSTASRSRRSPGSRSAATRRYSR